MARQTPVAIDSTRLRLAKLPIYEGAGFRPSPIDPMTLMITLEEVRRTIETSPEKHGLPGPADGALSINSRDTIRNRLHHVHRASSIAAEVPRRGYHGQAEPNRAAMSIR